MFGVLVVVGSQTLPHPADRFPTLAGLIVIAMAGLRLVELFRGAPFHLPPMEHHDISNTWRLFWGLWMLGALTVLIGLIWGGLVWSVAFLMVLFRWSWLRSLIFSAAFMTVIALLFPALGLHLPGGILFGP